MSPLIPLLWVLNQLRLSVFIKPPPFLSSSPSSGGACALVPTQILTCGDQPIFMVGLVHGSDSNANNSNWLEARGVYMVTHWECRHMYGSVLGWVHLDGSYSSISGTCTLIWSMPWPWQLLTGSCLLLRESNQYVVYGLSRCAFWIKLAASSQLAVDRERTTSSQ